MKDQLLSSYPYRYSSAATMCRLALREQKLAGLSQLVYAYWPLTQAVTEALAWHITPLLQEPNGGSLLSLCIRSAFKDLSDTQAEEQEKEEDPFSDRVMGGYVRGLFRHLHLAFEVEVRGRTSVWSPLSSGPLADWIKNELPVSISSTDDVPEQYLQFRPVQLDVALAKHLFPRSHQDQLHKVLPMIAEYRD
ncbi:MAG: hypothetical protein IT475_16600 [Aquimonas sp.]|nr:hypothetical protein [Aquimonas sp.]